MKILKSIFLGLVFLLGLIAMTNATIIDEVIVVEENPTTPCYTVYQVCDLAHPNDYDLFDLCMRRNGC